MARLLRALRVVRVPIFPACGSPHQRTAPGIFAAGNRLQVVWANARADAAKVIPLEAIGRLAKKKGIGLDSTGRAMGRARPIPECSVSISKKAASPQPTGFRLLDIFPEALLRASRFAKKDAFGHRAHPIPNLAGAIVAPRGGVS